MDDIVLHGRDHVDQMMCDRHDSYYFCIFNYE